MNCYIVVWHAEDGRSGFCSRFYTTEAEALRQAKDQNLFWQSLSGENYDPFRVKQVASATEKEELELAIQKRFQNGSVSKHV